MDARAPATAAPNGTSFGQAWPAYAVVLLVFAAAVYSFSHRPLPAFPPTQLHPDKLLVNGLARSGDRLVAAGELGHILYADGADGPWREAKVEPQRGSTFTRAVFIDERVALAVGHDGWIVRSEDAGATWTEVAYDAQRPDPLITVAGPYDGKLFALGAFGLFLVSQDAGRTWQPQPLDIPAEAAAEAAAPVDPNADPFANFGQADRLADRHLNALARLGDGSLLLAGERGLLLRSRDAGATWTQLDAGYAGSFYGALPLGEAGVLVFGMRGNAFWSSDLGETWFRSRTPVQASLFSGTVLADGAIVLVGDNNSVLVSRDRGATFAVASQAAHRGLAAGLAEVVALPDGSLLTAGDGGIVRYAAPDRAP